MVPEPIKIQGLAEFRRQLRQVSPEAARELRQVHGEAADLVVGWARPRVPYRTGRAARSVRSTSTQTASKVTGGGARTPYYPWVDFGGRVGRRRSVVRSFLPGGRFIYPGYDARRDQVQDRLGEGVVRVVRSLGWDVTDG